MFILAKLTNNTTLTPSPHPPSPKNPSPEKKKKTTKKKFVASSWKISLPLPDNYFR